MCWPLVASGMFDQCGFVLLTPLCAVLMSVVGLLPKISVVSSSGGQGPFSGRSQNAPMAPCPAGIVPVISK